MLRSVVVTALVAVVALFAIAYLLLMSPPMQARLCREGEKALSEYLNTTVDTDWSSRMCSLMTSRVIRY